MLEVESLLLSFEDREKQSEKDTQILEASMRKSGQLAKELRKLYGIGKIAGDGNNRADYDYTSSIIPRLQKKVGT